MDPSTTHALRRPLPLVTERPGQPPAAQPRVQTLIDQFLAQQQDTTAVERFSQHHEGAAGNVRERWYRDLLPATPPAPGQQYAFDVDLDACSGCKACVVACQSLNGLDESEAWRSVGTLHGVGDTAIVQPVTTACHHCADPACLEGCPVDAYSKDPVTGIVEHHDDQCIGCRYCTLTCPYDVPQYNGELGIVRKCDLCHDRLEVGEAPACVQACPTQAISIRVVDLEDLGAEPFPFEAPRPEVTRPATTFRSTRPLADDVVAADRSSLRPSGAHPPLTLMLVLTQAAVGAHLLLSLLAPTLGAPARRGGALGALLLAVVALGASVGHLGRPHLAWRAVIGLRHSWLSREIVAFGAFAGLATAAAVAGADLLPGLPLPDPDLLAGVAGAAGLTAVGTSAMVYVVTGRHHWRAARTFPRYAATVAAAGGAVATLAIVATGSDPGTVADALDVTLPVAGVGAALALAIDGLDIGRGRRGAGDAAGRTGLLLTGPLVGVVQARLLLGVVGVGTLLVTRQVAQTASTTVGLVFGSLAVAAVLGAELLERWWFFTAESDVRMPGARP